MTDQSAPGPLRQLRVLDLTTELGRLAGKVLADFGADVVRLLPGERGPDISGPDAPGLLDYWHDSGCRQATLNLDQQVDIERFKSLVATCDVLLDAQPAAPMAARGLGRTDLAAINPQLVHVAISPYGADGSRSDWRTSDLVAQALGGYLSVTGDADNPVALWGRQAAMVGGFYAAIEALAGVRRARTTGDGCWVDLSLHEAVISCSEHLLMYWWFPEILAGLGAPIAVRQRSLHWIRAFEVVPCGRGACMVSPAAGGLLELIAWLKQRGHAQDVPDVPGDEELLSLVPTMMEALKAAALESDATELFEAGQSMHVPFGEAYAIPQVAGCGQHLARGFFRPLADLPPTAQSDIDLRMPGPLARLAATPLPVPRHPKSVEVDQVVEAWAAATAATPASAGESSSSGESPPDRTRGASQLPLAGLRVLDFTHVLAGPFATRAMADLGADVIRVQTEERMSGASANEFPYNVLWARSKRSIQLQMKHRGAAEVLQQLVAEADVVIDNFSAGVMTAWGAGPEQLAEWNPGIISMSMSGCGADGPWKDYVTYAPTIHALCGLTALTGPPGETDCGPGIAYNDHLSGLAGAVTLLAAVEHRNQTGQGQHIDMSQLEVGTYLVGPAIIDYMATGREYRSNGNVDPFADYLINDVFKAADGDWLAVTFVDDDDWSRAAAAGLTGTASNDLVAKWVAGRSAVDAQTELQAAGVAAGVVQTAQHMANQDRQLADRDWLVTMESPMIGSQTTERHPARWHGAAGEIQLDYRPSPYLGEHNFEIYEELLGWDAERIAVAIGDELII